jgi:hypothetical protein
MIIRILARVPIPKSNMIAALIGDRRRCNFADVTRSGGTRLRAIVPRLFLRRDDATVEPIGRGGIAIALWLAQ